MNIIRADTDQLRAVARQMRTTADQITGGHDGIQQSFDILDTTWSGRARDRGMARWAEIAPKYRPSADGLVHMANELEALAQRLDDAAAVFGGAAAAAAAAAAVQAKIDQMMQNVLGASTGPGDVKFAGAAPKSLPNISSTASSENQGQQWALKQRELNADISALEARLSPELDLTDRAAALAELNRKISDLDRQWDDVVAALKNPLNHLPFIGKADQLWKDLERIMNERAELYGQRNNLNLLGELHDQRGQSYALLDPYLAPSTNEADRAALISQLPSDMQKSIMSGPARTIHDAPLQIPIADLDRKSYRALVNQFMSCPQNSRYAPSNGLTYCDVFVRDVLTATGTDVKEFGSVNAIANSLEANPDWEIVSADEAQQRADQGVPAVAILRDPPHTAMIVPEDGTYDPQNGPRIAQSGENQYMIDDGKHMQDGFRGYTNKTYYLAYKGSR